MTIKVRFTQEERVTLAKVIERDSCGVSTPFYSDISFVHSDKDMYHIYYRLNGVAMMHPIDHITYHRIANDLSPEIEEELRSIKAVSTKWSLPNAA